MYKATDFKWLLRIFLCHSSSDKEAVRDLYWRLRKDGFNPWLDEQSILPGQKWQQEVAKAVRMSDIVIVCLSQAAVNKRGYIHKEIKDALDVADEHPEDTIFLVPVRLEECKVPDRLKPWHWVDLFQKGGYDRLVHSLILRAEKDGKIDMLQSQAIDSLTQVIENLTLIEDSLEMNAALTVELLNIKDFLSKHWDMICEKLEGCERYAQSNNLNANMMFIALSLPIINGIIHVSSTRKDILNASDWVTRKWQSNEREKPNAVPIISALTLIYIVAKAWARYRSDQERHQLWDSIRNRVQMLISDTTFINL